MTEPTDRRHFVDKTHDTDPNQSHQTADTGDVYICYSEQDREQVEEIVHVLESEHHVSCLLDVRDFVGGKPIIENVISAINRCRKTVLVLSASFCNSSWCDYEMLLLLQQLLNKTEYHIIPIILEDCQIPQYISPLTTLDTRDPNFWSRFLLALNVGTNSQSKGKLQSSSSDGIENHLQLSKQDGGPKISVVSMPESPVCTGFHTPNHPHRNSDHRIVLAVKDKEDQLLHCDFTDSECQFSISLIEVTSTTMLEDTHESQNKNFYRVWQGESPEGMDGDTVSKYSKPWFYTFWFRFFGKVRRSISLKFGLYSRDQINGLVLLDTISVALSTKGRRPNKRRAVGGSLTFGMSLLDRKGILKKRVYKDVLKEIYEATLTGDWKEMDKRFTSIYNQFKGKSADIQILLLCRKIDSYVTHLSETGLTRQLIQKARQLVDSAENKEILKAKIDLTVGYMYRKRREFGKAQKYIDRAYEILSLVKPCFFRGEAIYNVAILKYDLLHNGTTVPPDDVYNDILSDLDKSIDWMETEPDLVPAINMRVKIKKAEILAERSRIIQSRTNVNKDIYVNDAERLLQAVEYQGNFKSNSLKYMECCLLQGKVSVFMGKGNFSLARQNAERALEIAEDKGFVKQANAVRKMLSNAQLQGEIERIKPHLEVLEDCFSDGYFADNSELDDEIDVLEHQVEMEGLINDGEIDVLEDQVELEGCVNDGETDATKVAPSISETSHAIVEDATNVEPCVNETCQIFVNLSINDSPSTCTRNECTTCDDDIMSCSSTFSQTATHTITSSDALDTD